VDIIVLSDNLYICDNVKNKKIIADIRANIFSGEEFLICLNNASQNLMDIYYIKELNKPYINVENLIVLAICGSKTQAKETSAFIIERFVQEYNEIGSFKSKVCLIRWDKND